MNDRADDGGGNDGEQIEIRRDRIVVAQFRNDADRDERHVVLDEGEDEGGPEAIETEKFSHRKFGGLNAGIVARRRRPASPARGDFFRCKRGRRA